MKAEVNKQAFAAILAIVILLVHVALAFYLFFGFAAPEGSTPGQIVTPPTVIYVVGIVKWFVDTQGKITSDATVGSMFVVAVLIIFIALFGGILIAPYLYYITAIGSADSLNSYFTFLESAFGASFAYFYRDMYKELPGTAVTH